MSKRWIFCQKKKNCFLNSIASSQKVAIKQLEHDKFFIVF